MSRISRQQMKRNEVAETVGSVVEYSRSHTRTLLYGAIALAVVVLIGAGLMITNQRRGDQASTALAEAMAIEGDDPAAARDRFLEVVDRYPRSSAAAAARLYLGRQAAGEGDYARARELWEAVVRGRQESALGLQAQHNLWELARAEGRHEELIGELRERLAADAGPLAEDQLLYQLGLTLEARGSAEEARETYLRLVEEHPESVLRGAAQERADRLAGGAA